MAAQPAKFMFDLDLGHVHERTRVVTETGLDEMIHKAAGEGFERGRAEGEAGAVAQSAARTAEAAEKLAIQAAGMASAIDEMRRQSRAEATSLAISVGKKLAGELLARRPTAELETLIGECLSSLDHAPHLVVRCHPDLADKVQKITEARMTTSGFTGRLVVMGDPEIALGDGRLEWVDGGVVRDRGETERQIDEAIAAWLDANGITMEAGGEENAESDQ